MNKAKSYCVIGLGRFGSALAKTLAQNNVEVLALDSDESRAKELRGYTENTLVVADLSLETLREAGVQNCDTVIVCIGEQIEASILATLHVSQLGVKNIIAKAATDDHGSILRTLGAQVVFPERDMGVRLGSRLTSATVLDYISLNDEVDISEFRLNARLSGQTIKNIDFRKRFGLNIIAIVRGGSTVIEIDPTDTLREGDVIAVVGTKENLSRFETYLGNH